ncbi:hypothetical protein [Clostridium cochlearium]|uniref:SMODS-associated NUDIX domain-containing protein n=1 Tax=Clostridium cochlearium TaxID=1494 RepID=UPI001A9B4F0F|nr:hypothetical protein [Clostridium cochlearium]MBV1818120.1 hypothetical protein [Bacteroidales bacterium MSK.15.36]MCG4580073.1 hypothetical protein [Clostridium cochlearium]
MREIWVGLLTNVIWFVLGLMVANYKNIILWLKGIMFWNKDIRFSISYLYRIKIDNKYLLIKGNRIDQYQPVGGVYKYYESFSDKINKYEIRSESNKNFYENSDLRFITNGKHISGIIKWLNGGENREVNVYREFYEEIVAPGFLPEEVMKNLEVEFLKQIPPKMKYSTHFEMQEILIFNIFEARMSEDYLNTLKLATEKHRGKLALVDREDIEKECFDLDGKSTKIGAHSKNIL